jgi:hypothetical protein
MLGSVLTEDETLAKIEAGSGCSRFGDGELKLATGSSAKSQKYEILLAEALADILRSPQNERCLVCIPGANPVSPKYRLWKSFEARRYSHFYSDKIYGSAFITRPDSAPWIDTPEYWDRILNIWRGQEVCLIRGSTKSFTKDDLVGAAHVEEVIGHRQHAWTDYRSLLKQAKAIRRKTIICLGATATVLAFDLSLAGIQGLDLGHLGMFMRREGRFDRESFPK